MPLRLDAQHPEFPAAFAALVDAMIAGEPFDAAQEQAGRASGWR